MDNPENETNNVFDFLKSKIINIKSILMYNYNKMSLNALKESINAAFTMEYSAKTDYGYKPITSYFINDQFIKFLIDNIEGLQVRYGYIEGSGFCLYVIVI